MAGDLGLIPSSPPQAIDWEREAKSLTFSLDPELLLAAARDVIPEVTGELVWVYQEGDAQFVTLYVHPVLFVHTASESPHADRIEIDDILTINETVWEDVDSV
jgi:hypothetical protein